MYEALRWALPRVDKHVSVESDFLLNVSTICIFVKYHTEVGHIIDTCRHILGQEETSLYILLENKRTRPLT